MKSLFLSIVLIHGLIHILGFLIAFELKEINQLTVRIYKPLGVLCLLTLLVFIVFNILYLTNNRFAWIPGFIAVTLSQLLIFIYWKDAKFGTIPNIVTLLVSLYLMGNWSFSKLISNEISKFMSGITIENMVLESSDIESLPNPVQKWLINTGVVGKQKIQLGYIKQKALIKMNPDQKEWKSAKAEQYTRIDKPGFIWNVDLDFNSVIFFKGRDKFIEGKGEMLIKINSLFNVVNATGEKINESSIQRFLGELVWFPSLAVSPYITWEQIDRHTAKATMHYKGVIGTGIFHFNENYDFVKFSALRFYGNTSDNKCYEWVITADEYKIFEEIKIPSKLKATWKLDEGDWTWLQLEIDTVIFNTIN